MKNVLLTGPTGFIGSHLAPKLKDYEVFGLLRHSPRNAIVPENVTPITGDLTDIYSLKKAMKECQPDYIIHTAALTPVRYSFDNPFAYAETNYIGTMNLIHAALETPNLKKFIVSSTAETYKPQIGRKLVEEDELTGSTPYGVTKVAMDLYVRMAGKCFGLPFVLMRPSNTYGRKTEKGYLTEKIITTMMTSDKLVLDGSPTPVRDYMYVDDHVEGFLAALKSDRVQEVYNISTGRATTVKELVDLAALELDWHGQVFYGGKTRPYDPESLVLDNTKARKDLDWEPKIRLEEGIRKVAEYWGDKL